MIQNIISKIKLSATFKIEEQVNKIVAANSLQELLNQIDFDAEIVQTNNPDKLKDLLISLKGKELSSHEVNIIQEISEH